MKKHHASRILTSLATISCCALLLADSAEPYCTASANKFDRTFDYTTTCNGQHAGRIRLTTSNPVTLPVSGGRTNPTEVSISTLSGEQPNADAFLSGSCAEEDDPTIIKSVVLSFPSFSGTSGSSSSSGGNGGNGGSAGAGGTGNVGVIEATCTVNLTSDLGRNVDCKRTTTDESSAGCTLQLTAFP